MRAPISIGPFVCARRARARASPSSSERESPKIICVAATAVLAEMSPACKRLRNLISQRLRPIMQICPELLFSYTREIFMQRRAVCCTYGPAPTLHFNLSRAALSLSYQSRSQKLNNSLPQRVEQMLPLNGENVKLLKVREFHRERFT